MKNLISSSSIARPQLTELTVFQRAGATRDVQHMDLLTQEESPSPARRDHDRLARDDSARHELGRIGEDFFHTATLNAAKQPGEIRRAVEDYRHLQQQAYRQSPTFRRLYNHAQQRWAADPAKRWSIDGEGDLAQRKLPLPKPEDSESQYRSAQGLVRMGEQRPRLEALLTALLEQPAAEEKHPRGPVVEYANIILKDMGHTAPARTWLENLPPLLRQPNELQLKTSAELSTTDMVALSGINRHFKDLLEDQVRDAFFAAQYKTLAHHEEPGERFRAMLDGDDAARHHIRHWVTQLPTEKQCEVLEQLAMHLVDLSRKPGELGAAVDGLLDFVHGRNGREPYAGQRSPLLNELIGSLEKGMRSGQMSDVGMELLWREQRHYSTILSRAEAGESMDKLLREFGIASREVRPFLERELEKRLRDGQ